MSLFDLSRLMGTSVDQLDKTYGHLLPDSLDPARTALDAYVRANAAEQTFGRSMDHQWASQRIRRPARTRVGHDQGG